MYKKYLGPVILVIVGVICILISIYNFNRKKAPIKQEPNYTELKRTIDSLNNKVAVLKVKNDSISHSIKDSKIRTVIKTKEYEKKLVDVTNQPVAFDIQFFTDYLSKAAK